MLNFMYLADHQQTIPDAYCSCCEAELWGAEADPDLFGHVLCPDCQLAILKRYNRSQATGGAA